MSNFTVRRAQARDSSDLAECIKAAYSIYSSRIDDLPAVSEGIVDAIEHHRVWIAEIEHQIVGGLILVPHDDFLLLENIAVRPEQSGLGLGRAL
ncbi:MAG: GNAT family N-acetyltransferase, partial [Acidiferrobacterales bacterium]